MKRTQLTRRSVIGLAVAGGLAIQAHAQSSPEFPVLAPIGWPGGPIGEGFRIGHGFACENTWFAPGWWHTGEDWYAIDDDTAGATVYAMAVGEVVYADFDYPGRVVIVQHGTDLFSVFGHLDHDLAVEVGSVVEPGQALGTVLAQGNRRGAGQAPSHLHHELRTFLTRNDVNGDSPQYGVGCGFQCPPGPGYWPIEASEHPADLGWRNPLLGWIERDDLIGVRFSFQPGFNGPLDVFAEASLEGDVVDHLLPSDPEVWTVLATSTGDSASAATSAEAYAAWVEVDLGNGRRGWIRWTIPSDRETGSDGRPSAVDLPFSVV